MKNLLTIIPLLSNPFIDRFNEGGPFFMSLIIICLISAILLLIFAFLSINKDVTKTKKMSNLASDVSILGLVIGFLGSIIGMIEAFDSIESLDTLTANPVLFATGLKVSFLTTLFGLITFILPRIGIVILKLLQK